MLTEDIDLGLNDKDDLPCPRCSVEMKKVFVTQRGMVVAVDHCLECEGYWFDSEELNKVIEDTENVLDNRTEELLEEGDHLLCPRCRSEMETQYLFNVIIDRCTDCNGIWLDRGELFDIQKKFRDMKKEHILLDIIDGML